MVVGTTQQITTTRPGQLDIAALEMPTDGNPEGVAYPLTASYADFITEMVSVENNQTCQFVLLIDFGGASEVQICPEVSQDHGLTFGPKAAVTGISGAGIKQTNPEALSFESAKYADFLNGTILQVRTPPYLVSETHFVRLRARAIGGGSPTLRAWKMGGQGL